MKKFAPRSKLQTGPLLLLICAVALSGCAHVVADQERLLTKAGFQTHPADTPERQALLANLPSHRFVRSVHGSQITYTYADPSVCHCLYVGSDWAYNNYRNLAQMRNGPSQAHDLPWSPYSAPWAAPVYVPNPPVTAAR